MAEKKKEKKKPMLSVTPDTVTRPGAAGAQLMTGLAGKLKEVTPPKPKKKTYTW